MKRAGDRRRDIQGLRALAVLLVVAYHAGLPLPGGFTGVDVFFAISGFVITRMLVTELASTGRIRLGRFYVRRVRRLLPALAVLLVVVALVGTLASPAGSQRMGALTGIWASLFAANLYLYRLGTGYFDVRTTLDPLLHTWTLAVEEQFYLLFPALLLLGWRVGRRALAAVVVAAVSAASFYLALKYSQAFTLGGIHDPQRFAFYASPTRAWEFGAGSLLALGSPWLARMPRFLADSFGAAGLAWIGVGALVIQGTSTFPGSSALLPVGGACALLAAGTAGRSLVARALSIRPAVWIGNLSYSWYLWHWPLIVFARALWPGLGGVAIAAAALSLAPAWLSYRYVENPIRLSERLRGKRMLAVAVACVAIPIAASGGLLLTQHALAGTAPMRAWRQMQLLHADVRRGCDEQTPMGERGAGSCTWKVARARGEVVLIGDSNAGQFTEPFVRAAARARYDATVATLSGCPFVDLHVVGTNTGDEACRHFDAVSLVELVRRRPSLVVIAARTDDYVQRSNVGLAALGGPVSYSTDTKARLWRSGLQSLLAKLARAGIPAIVVHPIPMLPVEPAGCAVVRVLTATCGGGRGRTAVDRELRLSVDAENAAVSGVPGVLAVGFDSAICSGGHCASERGGRMLYRDGEHLSVAGALTLTDRFTRLVTVRARA